MMTSFEAIGIILLTLLPFILMIWNKHRIEPQVQQTLDKRREDYWQKITTQYGEPVESLWTAEVPLLIYDGFLVMGGVRVPYDSIVNVTWNNADNLPWGRGNYQVIVRTNIPGHEFIHALMGNDPKEAMEMAEQIRNYMQK